MFPTLHLCNTLACVFMRHRYVFPCYNYIVSGVSTPVFMSIPIVFIWAGAFPALLAVTRHALLIHTLQPSTKNQMCRKSV